jgi:hypothetical protein
MDIVEGVQPVSLMPCHFGFGTIIARYNALIHPPSWVHAITWRNELGWGGGRGREGFGRKQR